MVPLGPFFYRKLELQEVIVQKLCNCKFDANIALNVESQKEIYWWINTIFEYFAPLNIPDSGITIYTDASLTGCVITDSQTPSGWRWDENEIIHINLLEMKAIQFGVLSNCKDKSFKRHNNYV